MERRPSSPNPGPDTYLARLVDQYQRSPESLNNYQLREVARYFHTVMLATEHATTMQEVEAHQAAILIMDVIDWRLKRRASARELERKQREASEQPPKPPEGGDSWSLAWLLALCKYCCSWLRSIGRG